MTLSHSELRILTALISSFKSHSIPALSHLYFTPAGPSVILSASDLEMDFFWPIPGALTSPISCPLAWFAKIARDIPKDGHLQIDSKDDFLCAYPSRGPSSRSPQPSFAISDAPAFSTEGFTRGGFLTANTVRAAQRALPFASEDCTRYVLNGVHLEHDGHVVATDGRRLAHSATQGTNLPCGTILPEDSLKALSALFPKDAPDDEKLFVWLNSPPAPPNNPDHTPAPTRLLANFATSGFLRVPLIDGAFPNWRTVLPPVSLSQAIVTLNEEFENNLRYHRKRASKEMNIRFDLRPADNTVHAQCYDENRGTYTNLCDPFPAGTYLGTASFSISARGDFVLDCLAYSGPHFRLIDSISPLVSGHPGSPQTILMPLRSKAESAPASK